MALIRPDMVVLNWLLVLPFFAALCAELFPRLKLPVHSAREAEAMGRGPFYLGGLASLMGVVLAVSLLSAITAEGVTADYRWTRDLYQLRFHADWFSSAIVVLLYTVSLGMHLHLVSLPMTMKPHHRAALLLLALGCGVAASLSADLIPLVLFLELALVALWLLIRLDGPRQANQLLAVGHGVGLLFVVGVLLLWQRAGDSSMAALPLLMVSAEPLALRAIALLLLVGLLPRVISPPFHGWLPGIARTSLPMALAVAVLLPPIAGAVLLRLLPGSLPLALIPAVSLLAVVLGLVGLWWGALRAAFVRELRCLAAWLTVAQSGYLLIAIGAAGGPQAGAQAVRAAALHLLVAPLALLALWSAASAVRAAVGTDAIAGLSGLVRRTPLAGAALLLGGLSLAGVPPLPGFRVQQLMLGALAAEGNTWTLLAVIFGDIVIGLAVLDAFRRAFLRREPPPSLRWRTAWSSLQLALLVSALIVISTWPAPLLEWSAKVSQNVLSVTSVGQQ